MILPKAVYWKFSSDKILHRLLKENQKQAIAAFELASEKGDMKELHRFFQTNCTSKDDVDYICEVTKLFLRNYEQNRTKDAFQNAEEVLQMYRTEGKNSIMQLPVVPGSSLKGSIRTALLNQCLNGVLHQEYYKNMQKQIKGDSKPGRYEGELQENIFNYKNAKEDPLRPVLISDCSFKAGGLVGTLAIVSFNEREEILEPTGAPIQAEVIRGNLLGGGI